MDPTQLRAAARHLMESTGAVFLATNGADGYPEVRALFNLRNRSQFPGLTDFFDRQPDSLDVYLSTNTSSNKVARLLQDPQAALYFCDEAAVYGLMLQGRMEVVHDSSLKERLWVEGSERYYPKGIQDPDYALLHLRPERARGWHAGAPFELPLP